jgi:hypothetical protein
MVRIYRRIKHRRLLHYLGLVRIYHLVNLLIIWSCRHDLIVSYRLKLLLISNDIFDSEIIDINARFNLHILLCLGSLKSQCLSLTNFDYTISSNAASDTKQRNKYSYDDISSIRATLIAEVRVIILEGSLTAINIS